MCTSLRIYNIIVNVLLLQFFAVIYIIYTVGEVVEGPGGSDSTAGRICIAVSRLSLCIIYARCSVELQSTVIVYGIEKEFEIYRRVSLFLFYIAYTNGGGRRDLYLSARQKPILGVRLRHFIQYKLLILLSF